MVADDEQRDAAAAHGQAGALQWLGLTVALLLGAIGLSMMTGGIASHALSRRDGDSPAGLIVAAIGLVLFLAAWAIGSLSFPTVTAIAGMAAAFSAAIGSVSLALAAVVMSRARPEGVDPARAGTDFWIAAGICLLICCYLILNWVLWTKRRGARASTRHVLHILTLGYGGQHFISGLSVALLAVPNMIQAHGLHGASRVHLETAVGYAGIAALSMASGSILVWHGAAALTGVPSTRFRSPPVWIPLAAALLAICAGAVLIQMGVAVGLMPLAQVAAVMLPGLAILALVSTFGSEVQAAARSTWRELLLMAAYGAAVAATVAAIVNTVVLAGALVVALTAHGALDGIRTTTEFTDALQNASRTLSQRALIVPLIAGIAVLGPLNEEFWKGFGVRLLRGHRPSRYRAFLWGLASGAGFGAAEVTEYGFAAFRSSPYRWWDAALVRGAASSMHALASGIVGIAWFNAFAGRRLRFLGLYLTAVLLHGSWNALSILTAARILPPFKGLSDHDREIALEIVIALIAAVILYTLNRLARGLAAAEAPHDSGTAAGLPGEDPAAAMPSPA